MVTSLCLIVAVKRMTSRARSFYYYMLSGTRSTLNSSCVKYLHAFGVLAQAHHAEVEDAELPLYRLLKWFRL